MRLSSSGSEEGCRGNVVGQTTGAEVRDSEREYEKPSVRDYGDLVEITAASGVIGTEDGVGKRIIAGVGGVGNVSIGILP